ncbi:shikimate kinase [Pelagibacteraceae bacterium]|nr:shikimate kinase [Pelagibacteraceae bacterium]
MIFSNYNKINITFCGMMGSGKSIIGKKFAKIIDFNFLDTDSFIEKKTGKSINQIFNESGEVFFRELEENYISKILNKKNYVFSLGGGVLNNLNLRNIIKKNSYNIYLEVEIKILAKRLESSKNRPLINNIKIEKKLNELIKKRENFYEEADLTIKNDKKISDTINKLKNNFQIYD